MGAHNSKVPQLGSKASQAVTPGNQGQIYGQTSGHDNAEISDFSAAVVQHHASQYGKKKVRHCFLNFLLIR